MSRNVLVVEWLNGALTASWMDGREVKAHWVSPAAVDTVEDFVVALPAALVGTQFKGREAVLVLEHRKLIYHLQEAPLARVSTVRRLIERQVAQSQFFEDAEAVWGIHQSIPVKGSQRFLLSLLPRAWVVELRDAFASENLRLSGIFSSAMVLARCLSRLPVDTDRPSMITTDLGGSLCLVAGNSKGHLLFARSVNLTANAPATDPAKAAIQLKVVKASPREGERLEQELNRTRLFCQQQFDVSLNKIWVLGENARKSLSEIRLPEGVSFGATTESVDDPHLIAREAATLTHRSPGSLLAQITGEDLRQRRVVGTLVAACLVASLAFWGFVTHQVHARDRELQSLQTQAEEVRRQNEENFRLWHELNERRVMVAGVGQPEDPPVIGLFCRYLGGTLPDAFRISRLEINQSSNRWIVRLEGRQRDPAEEHLKALGELEQRLGASPFKVVTTSSSRTAMLQENGQEIRKVPPGAGEDPTEKPFFIEGYIP